MTESEVEEYNETPAVNDPLPSEIAERTQELQKNWTDAQRRSHICPLELFTLFEKVL